MSTEHLQRQIRVLQEQVKILAAHPSASYADLQQLEEDCNTFGHIWDEWEGSYCARWHRCLYCNTIENGD